MLCQLESSKILFWNVSIYLTGTEEMDFLEAFPKSTYMYSANILRGALENCWREFLKIMGGAMQKCWDMISKKVLQGVL